MDSSRGRRLAKRLTLTAVLAGSLTAGASGLSAVAAAKQTPITVTYWGWGETSGFWQQVQKNLDKETGEDIVIDLRSPVSTSYNSVLTTAMDAGTGPDVFKDRTGTMMEQFAAAKLISPINGNVDLSHFGPAPISTVTYKGNVYGVPQVTEEMVAFYNKSIFSKLHLSVPSTWPQFIGDLSKIKASGATPLYMMGTQQWLVALDFDEIAASVVGNQNAQKIVDRQETFTSKPYVTALKDFQELGQYLEPDFQAVGAAGNEQEEAFAEGKSAVILDGLFDLSTIQQAKPKFQIGEFLIPGQTSASAALDWYPNASYSLNSKISDPKVRAASIDLLRYLSSPQYGKLVVDQEEETESTNGISIPPSEKLLKQAYTWYESKAIHPLIGIDSRMDMPPVNSKDIGIFQAEQNVLVQLLEKQATPSQAAKSIAKATSWYFHPGKG